MSMHEPATTDDPVTFVNIFEIPPGEVEQFISGWRDRAQLMSHAPGFRRAQLLRATSPDTHFQLINIAHWDSAGAWTAATATGEFRSRVAAVDADPAQHVTPHAGLYQPVISYTADNHDPR